MRGVLASHPVAYQGFYFKPDRIHEHLLDELTDLCLRTPGLMMTRIQIRRAFFGTYTMTLAGHHEGRVVESRLEDLDPFRGIARALAHFEHQLRGLKVFNPRDDRAS